MRKAISLAVCLFISSTAYASNDLCYAIRQAEGNPNYGIINGSCNPKVGGMCHYMCKEILRVYAQKWNDTGKWLEYVANRWAPIGSANDPTELNKNWKRNVKHFLSKY